MRKSIKAHMNWYTIQQIEHTHLREICLRGAHFAEIMKTECVSTAESKGNSKAYFMIQDTVVGGNLELDKGGANQHVIYH